MILFCLLGKKYKKKKLIHIGTLQCVIAICTWVCMCMCVCVCVCVCMCVQLYSCVWACVCGCVHVWLIFARAKRMAVKGGNRCALTTRQLLLLLLLLPLLLLHLHTRSRRLHGFQNRAWLPHSSVQAGIMISLKKSRDGRRNWVASIVHFSLT